MTLRSKVFLYLLLISVIGIVLTSFPMLFGFEQQFSDYLDEARLQNHDLIIEEIYQTYERDESLVSTHLESMMRQQAQSDDVFYELYDANGNRVLTTLRMVNRMGSMHMHNHMMEEVELNETTIPLSKNNTTIGTLIAYSPNQLVGADFSFFSQIRRNIMLAVVITIVLALFFSALFSKRLTKSFKVVSEAIRDLKARKLKAPVDVQTLSGEMKDIGEAVNDLALTLDKQERLRKQFTADFAHELRTPLATLRSQLEAYLDGVFEPTTDRLEKSHEELMRLVRLVNELESLIAAENPEIKLNKKTINANQLLSFMYEQFSSSFHDKSIQLSLEVPNQPISVTVDRDKLIQVLTNVINNALQYTDKEKSVKLSLSESSKTVTFTVQDEGKGISEDDLAHLFERFYRGDKSRDRKTGGIGIGLSIVKALVDAHKGRVEVKSKPNQGTTFHIHLPKQ
ncbi:two-component sensor histidine kinase [Halolactibacillus miurensis]|uniref:histidine kinase n=1 Tax=Halolactibacillus miurensis TaxID=306541 RepID=A0A1I6SCF2_9BACI|nr:MULTISPECIES: ATP-binding protein [Halolactibacillus]GEM04010.1 two-component sensor histidine kinase [Halolactibacillus miurensis]SFS74655.1 His Kinase A (phospho-acceptor) domain-containing protein [Halolactibacillus miurensis]